MYVKLIKLALAGAICLLATAARADITIGVTLSATGPAASLGIPEKNTVEMLPTTLAGQKVNWIVLDDGSDTTRAVTNTRKLLSEDKVDVVVGSTITPNSLAMIDVVADAETPMISVAASARIVDPTNPRTRWVFKTPQNDALMADAIAVHMKANGVKTLGYIGFSDAYGDGWLAEIKRSAQTAGIKVVAEEKYNRADTSVTGQVLKLVAANPDAVLIGERIGMQARQTQASAQAPGNVLVGNTGQWAGVDRHIRGTAHALYLIGFAVAQAARIAHFDDQIVDAARIAGEFALAPTQVGVGNALTDDLLEFAYAFCLDPLAFRLSYLARNAKLVLLRNIILLDFAIDGSDHGAWQLNAEDERVDERDEDAALVYSDRSHLRD